MLLRGVSFTWLLSLPTRGLMRMSYPTPCTILLHVGIKLECRVLGLGLFFFTWSPSFS
jgi:hypothetical protein